MVSNAKIHGAGFMQMEDTSKGECRYVYRKVEVDRVQSDDIAHDVDNGRYTLVLWTGPVKRCA